MKGPLDRPSPDLLCVGEAFEDLIFADLPRLPRPGEEIRTSRLVRTIGGGAIITAVAAARLGLRCRVLSALSPSAAQFLRAENVSVKDLRRPDESHAISAALSTRADRSFVTFNGVNDCLEDRLFEPVRRARARHIHLAFCPRDCGRWVGVLLGLRARGIRTSWDFGWNDDLAADRKLPDLLREVDYLFLNEKEALLYSGESPLRAAMNHWKKHPRNVIVKLGSRGCRWLWPGSDLLSPAWPVRVVDTTGAGDAFNGGFLCALLQGKAPEECLRMANHVGGLSTRSEGGINSLPSMVELQ
ncbi:MAG: carbohydrate kinase family protein [Acidobacteria bacterium]|nr:carbohydrate kinase family protein [Acidobacteriota bacterium]